MPEQMITITLTREEAERLAIAADNPLRHLAAGCPHGSRIENKLRAALDNPQPESYTRGEVEERLELVVLCGELRRIAEEGKVPNPSEHGLAVDVLTWAEGWLLQLSTAFPEQQHSTEEGR